MRVSMTEPLDHVRVRAPALHGRGWLNTGGRSLSLDDLRGRVVVLDFWTFCCVNCLHVLDELRPLEQAYPDVLVVVGVHSPKFAHEADQTAVADAVERHGVAHPVLDDPELVTWRAYVARAWPTLVVVDPEGYVVARLSGEGHGPGLAALVEELIAQHTARGTLRRGDGPLALPPAPATALRFPGKALITENGILVADTAHHQLVLLAPDLVTERLRIGEGAPGLQDGDTGTARFAEPQGLVALPRTTAEHLGYDVVVADSANHALRGVRLSDGGVTTLAGTGAQLRRRLAAGGPAVPGRAQALSTPWDVSWWQDQVVVAMAGSHQLWAFHPEDGTVTVLAGTTNEGLRDGDPADAWFAQPSGLCVDPRSGDLLVADSETSAVRRIGVDGTVSTVVGRGLFDFGFRDGALDRALLQHPLGVAALPDSSLVVADTYNGAVRRIDVARGELTTVVDGLREPSDVVVEEGADGPVLVVVESAAHRLVRVPVPAEARLMDRGAHRVRREPVDLPAGAVRLVVHFAPPKGQHLDAREGDPTRLTVSATPSSLLVAGSGTSPGLVRDLVLGADADEGVLHVSAQAAACDAEGTEFPACHLYQQDWGVPVRVRPGGASAVLDLHLRGV